MRIKADNTAERVEVKAGASDGELTAVTGAITAGDNVVVRGAERLSAGQKVRIAERAAVAAAAPPRCTGGLIAGILRADLHCLPFSRLRERPRRRRG